MESLTYFVALLARHTVLTMLCVLALPVAHTWLCLFRQKQPTVHVLPWIVAGIFLLFYLIFANRLADTLIYKVGLTGKAAVVGQHQTGVYNNQDQPIERFEMLIYTQDGRTVESGFDDDESVVYPYRFSPELPHPSEAFNVRYLARAPQLFVILTNDDSPWAIGVRCRPFASAAAAAESKYAFAPADPAYRRGYHDAVAAVLTSNCPLSPEEAVHYQKELAESSTTQ